MGFGAPAWPDVQIQCAFHAGFGYNPAQGLERRFTRGSSVRSPEPVPEIAPSGPVCRLWLGHCKTLATV